MGVCGVGVVGGVGLVWCGWGWCVVYPLPKDLMPRDIMSSELRHWMINSEGFLAEVFHPWVRWEGPGSGFENSSGGVWKSRIHRFGPLGIEVEKQGFRTAWLITGQKFP